MNIDRALLIRQTMAQSTQNVFWSIGLNEYLDVLGEMIGEDLQQGTPTSTMSISSTSKRPTAAQKSPPT